MLLQGVPERYPHEFASPEQWGVVQKHTQQWIEQALQMTGVTTLRKRRLPIEQALWLVLGVALLRDRSIVNVAGTGAGTAWAAQ